MQSKIHNAIIKYIKALANESQRGKPKPAGIPVGFFNLICGISQIGPMAVVIIFKEEICYEKLEKSIWRNLSLIHISEPTRH